MFKKFFNRIREKIKLNTNIEKTEVSDTDSVKKRFVDSPFMSEFSTYFLNCRRNLFSLSVCVIFYSVYGSKLLSNTPMDVLGVKIHSSHIDTMKPLIMLFLIYLILHFTYLSVVYIRENLIRITGEKPSYAKDLRDKLKHESSSLNLENVKPERDINIGSLVGTIIENDNIFYDGVKHEVSPKNHILNALGRFEKYLRVFKAEQIITKIGFDIIIPISLGVISLAVLGYELQYYVIGFICFFVIWRSLSTNRLYSVAFALFIAIWVSIFSLFSYYSHDFMDNLELRIEKTKEESKLLCEEDK